jgi:hypothetical protein
MEILTRKLAMFEIAAEFAAFILGDDQLEGMLRRGIVENQYIQSVFFQIRLKDTNEICAEISFEIDWQAHEIAMRTDGNAIKVRAGHAVSEQIIESAPYLSSLIKGYSEEYGETEVTTAFCYVPSAIQNEKDAEKVLKTLGHRSVEPDDENWLEPEDGERFTKIEVCPEKLSEFKLTIKGVGAQKR